MCTPNTPRFPLPLCHSVHFEITFLRYSIVHENGHSFACEIRKCFMFCWFLRVFLRDGALVQAMFNRQWERTVTLSYATVTRIRSILMCRRYMSIVVMIWYMQGLSGADKFVSVQTAPLCLYYITLLLSVLPFIQHVGAENVWNSEFDVLCICASCAEWCSAYYKAGRDVR